MRAQMSAAYRLIADFRRGAITPGSEITKEQRRLIELLASDLDVPTKGVPLEDLLLKVAKVDSLWNKRTVHLIDSFYVLRGQGKQDQAERERATFLQRCPSVWYCAMVSSL
jgi:hypothetical protein